MSNTKTLLKVYNFLKTNGKTTPTNICKCNHLQYDSVLDSLSVLEYFGLVRLVSTGRTSIVELRIGEDKRCPAQAT